MKQYPLHFLSLCLLICGCSSPKQLQLIEFKTGESIEAFLDSGTREIRVYLNTGEILKGKYQLVNNPRFTIGGGGGLGSYGSHIGLYPRVGVDAKANLYALIKSNRSKYMLEVIADYDRITGSGHGEARANDGKVYKLVF